MPKKTSGPMVEVIDISLSLIELHSTYKHRSKENLALGDLMSSIKEHGLIHPPTVRTVEKGYELIAGFRRFGAIKRLGWKRAKFTVIEMDDRAAMSVSLTENAGRKDLTPIEEAKSFRKAIDQVGMQSKEIAKTIGKSEPYISNRLKLLELASEAQEAIDGGKITPGHAEHALFKIPAKYPQLQRKLTKEIIKDNLTADRATWRAKSIVKDQETSEAFQAARKTAKFPTCPKCKSKPKEFNYRGRNVFDCSKNYNHEWDHRTGKMVGYSSEEYRNQGIKAAQEARKNMEAPRTAYFDTTMKKVRKLAHRKALQILKGLDPAKGFTLSLDMGGRISVGGNVEISSSITGGAAFHVEERDNDKFVKTFIPYGDPKKKDYKQMAEFLEFPEQLTHSGKPSKTGVLSAKVKIQKVQKCPRCKEPLEVMKSITGPPDGPPEIVASDGSPLYECPSRAEHVFKLKDGKLTPFDPRKDDAEALRKAQDKNIKAANQKLTETSRVAGALKPAVPADKPEKELTLAQKIAMTNKKIGVGSS